MTPDMHRWVHARAAAWSAGVLDDAEAARFDAHIAECEACRAWCASLQPDPEAPAGDHVPAGLLARWPRVARDLRGLERELVRAHVARCDECRALLQRLGHDPSALQPATLVRRRSVLRPAWGLAAAAVLVAAAVLLARRPTPGPARPAPAAPSAPAVAALELRAVRDWPADAIELRGPRRGAAAPEDAVVPADRAVTLTTPAIEAPPAATIEAVLVGPDGAVAARMRVPASALGARPAFVLDPRGAPLAAGRWELRLSSGGRDSLRVAFRVAAPR